MSKSGFALLFSIFLILAFAVLGMTVLSIIPGLDTDIWVRQLASSQALYLAESARNFSQEFHLPWGTQFSNTTHFPGTTTKTFSPGTFTIAYSNRQAKTVTASFQGNVGACKRKIQINYDGWTNLPQPFKQYVFFQYGSGEAWLTDYSNATGGDVATRGSLRFAGGGTGLIDKDVYAMADVSISPNHTVNGNVYYSGMLVNGGTIKGSAITPCPTLPAQSPFTTLYFDKEINIAQTYGSGSPDLSNLNGKNVYINGNVNLAGTISGGPANIVSTGAITLWNGTTIGEKINLISKTNIVIKRRSTIGGGQTGAGSLIYSANLEPATYSIDFKDCYYGACQIKGSILDPFSYVQYGQYDVYDNRLWGIIYASTLYNQSGEFYGHIQVGQGKVIRSADIIYDSSYIPLCVKGLYGVQRGAWQELSQ